MKNTQGHSYRYGSAGDTNPTGERFSNVLFGGSDIIPPSPSPYNIQQRYFHGYRYPIGIIIISYLMLFSPLPPHKSYRILTLSGYPRLQSYIFFGGKGRKGKNFNLVGLPLRSRPSLEPQHLVEISKISLKPQHLVEISKKNIPIFTSAKTRKNPTLILSWISSSREQPQSRL